ncbi:MAG: DUF2797 domain-containing protein [Flavobacteriaceae bacterium]
MQFKGVLTKMITEHTSPIQYYLELEDDFINVNQLIDKQIEISFEKYQCLTCQKNKKIFRQGNCYDCFYKSPNVGEWIINPELSKAHLGIEDRDLDYEKRVQLQPHIVYLALSSNVKVGVTRKPQIPTRWIDQGATKALAIVETPNRYLAGITEVALKKYVSDKTSWQKMLKNEVLDTNLIEEKEKLYQYIPEETKPYFLKSNTNVYTMNFPVVNYPTKIKSMRLDKVPVISGKLKGIKGQYLIFEDGSVFNVRNNEGHVVTLKIT